MLECSYCAKKFKYESEKKRHELSHIPQFECGECCKKFSFLSALKRHQKQHERTYSVVCIDCKRSFRDEALLKRHVKYAHKGTHVCSKCSLTFNSEQALSSHMKSHRPKSDRRFKCNYTGCNKSFNFTHHLKHHELTHTNQKQYSCSTCGKGFIQLHHLKTHLKSHTGDNTQNGSDLISSTTSECTKKRRTCTVKTTSDSGVSSDSNCDIPQDFTKGSKLCVTCGQIIELSLYEIHKEKCILNEGKLKDVSVHVTEEFNNNYAKVKPELKCELILGGCIVGGDSRDNSCLCAQIKIDADFVDIEASPIETFNVKKELPPLKSLGNKEIAGDSCGGCDCSQKCFSKKSCNLNTNIGCNNKDYTPSIEYRKDGVIKIKDTFDIDLTVNRSSRKDVKVEQTNDTIKLNNFVPYNSCQAVLGSCIVSGNGNISEECLCAKMAMDDQTIIAQEIDEITPQPKIPIR